eukprot:TRINITY_DN63733_c0_g1_i1.p1 TRINITY_DN63733_c0_g1~~TRINITY_DN63733_c0_g1_i1.p1  ORF type:complete len:738 (+),score=100.09 TRINITY_DN63733_c0_g1_i1:34-2247(+)
MDESLLDGSLLDISFVDDNSCSGRPSLSERRAQRKQSRRQDGDAASRQLAEKFDELNDSKRRAKPPDSPPVQKRQRTREREERPRRRESMQLPSAPLASFATKQGASPRRHTTNFTPLFTATWMNELNGAQQSNRPPTKPRAHDKRNTNKKTELKPKPTLPSPPPQPPTKLLSLSPSRSPKTQRQPTQIDTQRLRKQKDELGTEVEGLKAKLQNQQRQIHANNVTVQHLEAKCKQKDSMLKELEKQLSDVVQERMALRAEQEDNHAASRNEIEELENKIQTLEHEQNGLMKDMNDLLTEKQKVIKENEALSKQNEELKRHKQELSAKAEQLKKSFEEVSCQKEKLAKNFAEVSRQNGQLGVKNEELVKTNERLATTNERLLQSVELHKAKRAEYLSLVQSMKGTVKVLCRISGKSTEGSNLTTSAEDDTVSVTVAATERTFQFDKIFNTLANNSDVFSELKPLIASTLDGYRTCTMSFGRAASDRSFTMWGNVGTDVQGVAQLAVLHLLENKKNNRYSFHAQCVQIGNDVFTDLLATYQEKKQAPKTGQKRTRQSWWPGGGPAKLDIKYTNGNPTVTNGAKVQLTDADSVKKLFATIVPHCNNSEVSTVLTITVSAKATTSTTAISSTLQLVDLAASDARVQNGNENTSHPLHGLSEVFGKLAKEGSKEDRRHPPSIASACKQSGKLTHLLQASFANSKLAVIGHLQLGAGCEQEDHSDLSLMKKASVCELGQPKKF